MKEKIKTVKEYIAVKDSENYILFEKMGIFKDMSFEESYKLFLKLEEMSAFLMSEDNIDLQIEVIIFPIVVATYRIHNHLINSCKVVYNYIHINLYRLDEVKEYSEAYPNRDLEAEFCNEMASEIANLKL